MSASSSIQALEYLQGLPLQTHRKLYEAPSTVLAVFRCMLPHLGAKSSLMLPGYRLIKSSKVDCHGYAVHACVLPRS
jgi:hypothetical protein